MQRLYIRRKNDKKAVQPVIHIITYYQLDIYAEKIAD